MKNSYEELCNKAFLSLHKEEAVRIIVNYLKEKISFDSFRASISDIEDKSIINFISYEDGFSDSYAFYTMKSASPIDKIEAFYGKNFDKVYIKPNDAEGSKPNSKAGHSKKFCSSMTICIDVNTEKKKFTYIKFSSFEKDVYSNEEAELLIALRPFLREILCSYYNQFPETMLTLSSEGVLPHNHIEQLKMCSQLASVVKQIEMIAKYDTTVFISGATGTGKELVAESIHALSPRKNKPFVAVNCGAIAESLLESELFGSEKGAYTSSVQTHKGYFEQANHGTLYLDEIGELSKSAQKRLLRVLENHTIQRVGGDKNIKLDIRVIVATHRNLYQMVQENTFREDLFYRLHVYPIEILSLAQRKKDIPVLVEYFYTIYALKFNVKKAPKISYSALNYLISFPWTGNVRQLRYAVERALINAIETNKKELDFSFLESFCALNSVAEKTCQVDKKNKLYAEIQEALQKSNGKLQGKNSASELLNVPPSTLRSRMKALGIRK